MALSQSYSDNKKKILEKKKKIIINLEHNSRDVMTIFIHHTMYYPTSRFRLNLNWQFF